MNEQSFRLEIVGESEKSEVPFHSMLHNVPSSSNVQNKLHFWHNNFVPSNSLEKLDNSI